MEFKLHVKTSENFAKSNGLDINVVEEEEKIHFRKNTQDVSFSFYISAEKDAEDIRWTVWSDEEVVLPHLESFLESLEENKELENLLTKVNEKLCEKCKNKNLKNEAEEGDDEDEDGDFDQYYADDDVDATNDDEDEASGKDEDLADMFFAAGNVEKSAIQRLCKDLKNMEKTNGKFGIHAMPRGDNLLVWDVKLMDFPTTSKLGKDLKAYAEKYKREPVLYMEMQFPPDYPMSPPFVRVLRPRMQFLTGHVTIGGSICMELLTKSGWRPTNDIESILINVRSEIMSDPRACLDTGKGDASYTEQEARDAFRRMVQRYNWDK